MSTRRTNSIARILFVAAIMPASQILAQSHDGPPILRLPPTESCETLPDEPNVILFAGGSVELRVPGNWWVWELPYGREIRLAASPIRPAALDRNPAYGLWIAYHARPMSATDTHYELMGSLDASTRAAVGDRARLGTPTRGRVASWPAVQQPFVQASNPQQPGAPHIEGRHILVRAPWGILELHASAQAENAAEQNEIVDEILERMSLNAPIQDHNARADAPGTTLPIVGAWKAYRSRLRLRANGSIEIEPDRARFVAPIVRVPDTSAPNILSGRYRAENDLLFVEWNDGSRLNFRWKLSEGNLLLTDHDGQISQLRRIYE